MNGNWFVGLPVSPAGWLDALLRDVPDDLRRFHPDDVHITVAFLGRCGQARAEAAWSCVEAALHAQPLAPIAVTFGPLAPFGPRRRFSALSLLIEQGRAELVALIEQLRDPAIAAAEARPETREPKPHLTVARPPRQANAADRRRALRWAEQTAAPALSLQLDRIALYTWSEERPRKQFRVVREMVLAG